MLSINITNRIGLLGGSFNPAHAGHVGISREARKLLGLDQIWWLVTERNPLKSGNIIMPIDERISTAEELTRKIPYIKIYCDPAASNHTVDTVSILKNRYGNADFVWLMGADNLVQFHKWYKWNKIMYSLPIAVFDRIPYKRSALYGKAAKRFSNFYLDSRDAVLLAGQEAPVWTYLRIRAYDISSTDIRQKYSVLTFQ